MFSKIGKFYHTVKYLRLVQIYSRLFFWIYKPKVKRKEKVPAQEETGTGVEFLPKQNQTFYPPRTFRFLNNTLNFKDKIHWNSSSIEKLLIYNLHYFDDLNTKNAEKRVVEHIKLIDDWIGGNPIPIGNAWEPYPLSLRVVNWIKWSLKGNKLSDEQKISLYMQAEWLSKKMEFHLLGNHLIANAKALLFAGCFFKGDEPQAWLTRGIKILCKEINEQVLSDGGHFERSPMYHSIILEDLFDIINLSSWYPKKNLEEVRLKSEDVVQKMVEAMRTMSHPDGDIAFFNDAALNIAANLSDLIKYRDRLGLEKKAVEKGNQCLPETGYLSFARGELRLIIDAGPIGPDYLPAHAHADTLSFELSIGKQRVLVNSGTSCYGIDKERIRQRKTPAHNTLFVDDEDSSEVWSGFRVARRAKIVHSNIVSNNHKDMVQASHDGYRRLKNVDLHNRKWELTEDFLKITDTLTGSGFHKVGINYHFHPMMSVVRNGGAIEIFNPNKRKICRIYFDDQIDVKICTGTYHPEFGISIKNNNIKLQKRSILPTTVITEIQIL